MTCIVGVAEGGKAYIGADSAAANDWMVRATGLHKVFRRQDSHCSHSFVVGYTTSFRMGQILQHHLMVEPQKSETDEAYMVCTFVEAVRSCLKDHGFAKVENNVEKGGTFLVGYKGIIYEIASDFQVNHYVDGFAAIGCGEAYALGALKALDELSPEKRILRSLEIAAYFSGNVIGPFLVISE